MTNYQKKANDQFFKQVASGANNYLWPNTAQFFDLVDGKFKAKTSKSKKLLMKITTPSFHKTMIL